MFYQKIFDLFTLLAPMDPPLPQPKTFLGIGLLFFLKLDKVLWPIGVCVTASFFWKKMRSGKND